jgi:hypothetical protein
MPGTGSAIDGEAQRFGLYDLPCFEHAAQACGKTPSDSSQIDVARSNPGCSVPPSQFFLRGLL